jgi:hypothetical protein
VPRLILAHNLHGIDIDLRCTQIAALALWLRCQRAYREMALKKNRPKITRSHLVCAEPMPGEEQMLAEVITQLAPKLLGQLVKAVFDEMAFAGEAGSLLRIEEGIRGTIAGAKKQWIRETTHAVDAKGRTLLFTEAEMNRLSGAAQASLFDVSEITDAQFFEQAEAKIVETLRTYAESAHNGAHLQRRLFADDAVRGFSFVDLCRQRFDVALMNPPFGEASKGTVETIENSYPFWNKNVLCAFISRCWDLLSDNGTLGVIFDRTAVIKSTYEDFRRQHLIPARRLTAMADLGWEVLDANVEVTSCVLSRQGGSQGTFIDARAVVAEEKGDFIRESVQCCTHGESNTTVVFENPVLFESFPNAVIGYDFPRFLRNAFRTLPTLQDVGFKAYQGHALRSEKHFRLWWEISQTEQPAFVARMFNGAGYSPLSAELSDCVIADGPGSDLRGARETGAMLARDQEI